MTTPADQANENSKREWRELGPTQQAGIRCKEPVFWAWLREQGYAVADEESAADLVRELCCVLTRSDLSKPGFDGPRVIWFDIDTKFQAWRARENA